jgi:hypothetical protein
MTSIYYHTNQDWPPPYCYEVYIEMDGQDLEQNVVFEMNYTHRDSLSEEEIETEGFTENDNFAWSGKIEHVWYAQLDHFKQKLVEGHSDKVPNFVVTIGEDIFGVNNELQVENFIQDLLQAIFETAQRDAPWNLHLLQIAPDNTLLENSLEVSFAKRTATMANGKKQDWLQGKKLMETLYSCEIVDSKALNKKPWAPGQYLSFDQEYWFKIGSGIIGPEGNKQSLEKLKDLLTTYF